MSNTKNLKAAIARAILDTWDPQQGVLDSRQVRERLDQQGVTVPDNAMLPVLEQLQANGAVVGRGYLDSEAAKRHGGFILSQANVRLLELIASK